MRPAPLVETPLAFAGPLRWALLASVVFAGCRINNTAFDDEQRRELDLETSSGPSSLESGEDNNRASGTSVASTSLSQTASIRQESSGPESTTSSKDQSSSSSDAPGSSASSSTTDPVPEAQGYCAAPAHACFLMQKVGGMIRDELHPSQGFRETPWTSQKNNGMDGHFEYSTHVNSPVGGLYSASVALKPSTGFGIDLWLQSPTCNGSGPCIVMGTPGDLVIVYEKDKGFTCGVAVSSKEIRLITPPTPGSNLERVHVGCVNTGSKVQLWVDGNKGQEVDPISNGGSAMKIIVGGFFGQAHYSGRIFALRVWTNAAGFAGAVSPKKKSDR